MLVEDVPSPHDAEGRHRTPPGQGRSRGPSAADADPADADPAERDATLFQSRWWLDAAAGTGWEAVSAANGDGATLWLPYARERCLGLTRLGMPALTHTLGPLYHGLPAGPRGLTARRLLLGQALARLPRHAGFFQVLDPAATDAAEFAGHGFEIGVRYTFRVDTAAGLDAIWAGLKQKARSKVRAAGRSVDLAPRLGLMEFYAFYEANLAARGYVNHHDRGVYERLAVALAGRDRHRILAARDRSTGRLAAAVLLLWDRRALYYLRTTRDPAYPVNGVPSLLVWEAIRLAAELGLPFDSDTYAGEGGARFLQSFGASPVARLTVSRRSAALRVAEALVRRIGRRKHVLF